MSDRKKPYKYESKVGYRQLSYRKGEKRMIEFPIKYFEGNLVFSQDGSCWAYYELEGYNYDFLADDEKDFIFTKIKAFFWQIQLDTHYVDCSQFSINKRDA